MKRALIALSLLLAAAATAVAATPEGGKLSGAQPSVEWTGEAPGYGVIVANLLLDAAGEGTICRAPACDTFALTLEEAGDLTVTVADTGEQGLHQLDLIKPDGTRTTVFGEQDKPTTLKLKKAPKGAYKVQTHTNHSPEEDASYTGKAILGSGAGAPAPVPSPDPGASPSPAPTSTPAPSATPAPAAQPSATLSLRTRTASARKARKRLRLGVGTSSPVTDFKLFVRRGNRVVASGGLARLDKTGRLTLRLSKPLKKGAYVVAMSAKDGRGAQVGATARLTVKK